MPSRPLADLEQHDEFIERHIGPNVAETQAMLASIGAKDLDSLIAETVPPSIRFAKDLPLPPPSREHEALATLRQMSLKNRVQQSFIGMGYYSTLTPNVILRNVMENPGWYTAYTPYQAEIAQGRLEALMNYQQAVLDLTGMEIANASLLDEATAAAEAMTMARRVSKSESNRFLVDAQCFPQTIDVVKTRATYFGFELIIADPQAVQSEHFFGALLQNPDAEGSVRDLTETITALKANGATVAVACDLMAQVLIKSPGAMGADIALGSSQRFGVPMGFGGPHAAFFATREANVRSMPGRIIGISRDARGKTAYRMTLQTREQHIRREKANSNICTSQVLLANMAGFYAVYHGPVGLRTIAERIHRLAALLASGLSQQGVTIETPHFFDTLLIDLGDRANAVYEQALAAGFNLRQVSQGRLGIACDETTTQVHINKLLSLITGKAFDLTTIDHALCQNDPWLPTALLRTDPILSHPVFNAHHTEHEMLRYMKTLQNRDLALDHAMISLGSCTMKLNATSEMIPVTWPEFAHIHPFAPRDQVVGYLEMIQTLSDWLQIITGFDAVCMQPNSGAQGEYAGLVAIARYHASRGDSHRNICLIPKSAHGTNPATAQMSGMHVVVVDCDEQGNVDVADLRAKAEAHSHDLACLMLTYPSTHGVFEEAVREICDVVHQYGGQVYMDGANLNAQVGLTAPGFIGADVSHMNLHKTFAIPHGGGGPGMGPIGLKAHLAPFMADHAVQPTGKATRSHAGQGAVSAAPFGSASILPISWMYIAMLGGKGIKQATQMAILNANYIANALQDHFPVLYRGQNGRVAHECILDIRPIKAATGIAEIDIAKRLMDYGFHAPTVSFPVAGTIMVEPTESEPKAELDRFIDAMIAIRDEIRQIESGALPKDNNPLKHAPHTLDDIMGEVWDRPYSRQQAVFPLPWIAAHKFWPFVNRIDDVYGDRNLNCACPPMECYTD